MLQLQITAPAKADITGIADYITTNSYEKYAIDFGNKLSKVLSLLCHNPNIGTARPRSGEGIRLQPMNKVNIIYRVKGDQLQILRVHHSALDSNKLKNI